MSLQTNLSASPYFDDFDQTKDFYRILFKPGQSVQTRELNQMQTLLQQQVERFGDHILKKGTIVDGCEFTFHRSVSYIKIKDSTLSGKPINTQSLQNYYIKNNDNLNAYILKTEDGYEAQTNTKTLYVRYLSSGTDGNTETYTAGDTLTVYDEDNSVSSINVVDGGAGFSNSDSVVFTSALIVQNTTGGKTFSNTFVVDEIITQATTNAEARIVEANTTYLDNAVVLRIKPLANNLLASNTLAWTFQNGYDITAADSGILANTSSMIGEGASATLTTRANGAIESVSVLTKGSGYTIAPYVSINSTTAANAYSANLVAREYIAQVQVSSGANAIGSGYAFELSSGVIYQKGFFSRVDPQYVVVSRYDEKPHQRAVGFYTEESIVNSNSDSSLLDNTTSTLNINAPGADRLKLTPILKVVDSTEALGNTDFFPLVEWSYGKPYKQNQTAMYDKIGDELAKRTFEESGNYVLDPYQMTTTSDDTFANTANSFNIVVDPGAAYIRGYKVESKYNYVQSLSKSSAYIEVPDTSTDVIYGNYIKVNERGGIFDFDTAEIVSLRDTAADYITGGGGTITAPGNEIGSARIRSIVLDEGIPGTADCTYKFHIFDVRMNAGENFKDVRSVYVNDTYDGIADVVLDTDPTTNASIAKIYENNLNSMLFGVGADAIRSANSLTYTYRVNDSNKVANTSGIITVSGLGANEYFPYVGTLSTTEEKDIVVVPLANVVSTANIAGLVSITSGNNILTGSGTDFITDLEAGDWIELQDGGNTEILQVSAITNTTYLTTVSNATTSFTTVDFVEALPEFVPVSLSEKVARSANVVANTTLNIDLGMDLAANVDVAVTYNVTSSNVAVTKTTHRQTYVKIQANTHSANVVGPWPIGVAQITRLRAVYKGDSTVNTSSTNVTNDFYIDPRQNANYLDIGYLHLKPQNTLTIGADDVLLVEFDYLTNDVHGLSYVGSYPINDTLTLDELTANTTMHTLEIPEVYTSDGRYYDLRDAFDFRPVTANTTTPNTAIANAPVNPAAVTEATRFTATTKKFPIPQGSLSLSYSYYNARVDTVYVTKTGRIKVDKETVRTSSINEIIIGTLQIPPYPSLPDKISTDMFKIMNNKIMNNGRNANIRVRKYTMYIDAGERQNPPYSMAKIGTLERRIEALEQYAQLSGIEDLMKNTTIPSSVNANIDRFKYGFYVDNFTTTDYSQPENPEFNCSIFDYRLYPSKDDYTLKFEFDLSNTDIAGLISKGGVLHGEYESYPLIQQTYATDGDLLVEIPGDDGSNNVFTPNTDPGAVCNSSVTINECLRDDECKDKNLLKTYKTVDKKVLVTSFETKIVDVYGTTTKQHPKIETYHFQATSNAEANGTLITLWYDLYGGMDNISISQYDGALVTNLDGVHATDSTAALVAFRNSRNVTLQGNIGNGLNRSNLTQAEKVYLQNKGVCQKHTVHPSGIKNNWLKAKNTTFHAGGYAKFAGKIQFEYDISKGRNFVIGIRRKSPYLSAAFEYPVNKRISEWTQKEVPVWNWKNEEAEKCATVANTGKTEKDGQGRKCKWEIKPHKRSKKKPCIHVEKYHDHKEKHSEKLDLCKHHKKHHHHHDHGHKHDHKWWEEWKKRMEQHKDDKINKTGNSAPSWPTTNQKWWKD